MQTQGDTVKDATEIDATETNGIKRLVLLDRCFKQEVLKTSALTALSTAALVGIHHRYRKQRYPSARLQDYVVGLGTQFQSLSLQVSSQLSFLTSPQSAATQQLSRLQYAYQQTTNTWHQAYQSYSSSMDYDGDSCVDSHVDSRINSADVIPDFSTVHTTTMLARPVCWVSGVASMPQVAALTSDEESVDGYGVVGIDADRQIVWQTTMPERVHDIVVQPVLSDSHSQATRDVVVMGRRPSEKFWVLDTASGQVKHAIEASVNRHFYGHACYSLDGKLLYVTENNTVDLAGKVGIYDINQGYQKIVEFDSHGIGPHELIMHPDGETLVIANGGIKTEQASREELNLDTMRPSLVYLNRHDGTLLEQVLPEHNQMSVRHLAMHDDGTVMIGIQFQGERHINVPLVLTHKRGDTDFEPLTMPNNQWQRFHQYIASVAVDSERNLLCVTTPIGGCAAIYDLTTRALIDTVSLPDCAGASVSSRNSYNESNGHNALLSENQLLGFIVSDGQGQLTTLNVAPSAQAANQADEQLDKRVALADRIIQDSQRHKMSFDNHLQALL
ncbi:DUF1513 domain-containing protein [Psychrobacter sp. SCQQ22]|uniref:DUF1513 domain-containing protein n=1 Tax=unclassified Psychrobacter TaxID=196806 RepID=UPI0018CDE548|nr:DUF1513 domain-containing protein [Psychrobacter sp. SCQQ22]MBH0086970.1 DUF1513 domain-containing protein [Psychrobacter sp. SCQQ22]